MSATTDNLEGRIIQGAQKYVGKASATKKNAKKSQTKRGAKKFSRASRTIEKRRMKFGDKTQSTEDDD